MDKRIPPARWVPVLAIAAVCIAALGAVTFGARDVPPTSLAQRPAADAPVHVVRGPASVAGAQEPCRTCTLGAGKGWL